MARNIGFVHERVRKRRFLSMNTASSCLLQDDGLNVGPSETHKAGTRCPSPLGSRKVKARQAGRILQLHLEFTGIRSGKKRTPLKFFFFEMNPELCGSVAKKQQKWDRDTCRCVCSIHTPTVWRAQRAQPGPRGQTEVNPM